MKWETPARASGSSLDPRADPEPERDRAHAGNALGDDALARRELGQLVLRHARIVSLVRVPQTGTDENPATCGRSPQIPTWFAYECWELDCNVPRCMWSSGDGSLALGVAALRRQPIVSL